MNKRLCFVFAALMAVPVALLGQEKSASAGHSASEPDYCEQKGFFSFVSNAVIGAARKMPEENYSFKPTPEVRQFWPDRWPCGGRDVFFLLASHR